MFEKLTHVPIVVRDHERALKFYTEVLGFEKSEDSRQPGRPRWLTVKHTGQDLAFILVQGDYVVDPRRPTTQDSGGNHWVFKTSDCRKDYDTLKARGVKFKEPGLVEASFGVAAYFTDPDGNHLSLLQPAQWQSKA